MLTIGIIKEIKPGEHRVGMTPRGVKAMTQAGIPVIVQSGAGKGSRYTNQEYVQAGAEINSRAKKIWDHAGIIIKVKEPLLSERKYLREDLILYNYDHLSGDIDLTLDLLDSKADVVPFETVIINGITELLVPMSRIAGRRVAWYVGEDINALNQRQRDQIRRQIWGFDDFDQYFNVPQYIRLDNKKVLVLGGGYAGVEAAEMSARMGAQVIMTEINQKRQRAMIKNFKKKGILNSIRVIEDPRFKLKKRLNKKEIRGILNNPGHDLKRNGLLCKDIDQIREIIGIFDRADAIIDTVYVQGGRAPTVVGEILLSSISGSKVIVDVSIDQGGGVEFVNNKGAILERITNHNRPVAVDKFGNRHYRVPNIPGSTPRVASLMLEDVTVMLKGKPYLKTFAQYGYKGAVKRFPELGRGITRGKLTDKVVAHDLGFDQ